MKRELREKKKEIKLKISTGKFVNSHVLTKHMCTNLMFIRRLTSQFLQLFRKSKTSDKILNLEKKMEITRHNFAEKLPEIEKAIKDASFIAIDGEFTGLHDDTYKQSSLDTPAERYAKSRNSVRKFLLVQFGNYYFLVKSQILRQTVLQCYQKLAN